MKQTYLFTKDSTLMAFEGPVKPEQIDTSHWTEDDHRLAAHEEISDGPSRVGTSWYRAMSTARESALPVVNPETVVDHEPDGMYIVGDVKLKPGEYLPLSGWGLEKLYQYRTNHWSIITKEQWCAYTCEDRKRQAYCLVRSETKGNSAHGFTEGSELIDIKDDGYAGNQHIKVDRPQRTASPESAPSPIEAKTEERQEDIESALTDCLLLLEEVHEDFNCLSTISLGKIDHYRRTFLTRK